ncbi:hypothetical protein [Devosia naphthalenivorans]|uniref:hypothetical protein n=1 Tax=Devosia naphthalenivorans TaxID=2082392 RepID=UPI000D3D692C|nr:hypothetical protein [Devosia naphthalenivorans]
MAKNTLPSAQTEYRIKPGVEWVNGKRVGSEKTIFLSGAEAAYALGNGHIAPADKPEPVEWSKRVEKANGGD